MGPKRFGAKKGALAFSFGNVAQDEGAAMAEYAYKVKHWRTATTVTDNVIVYFKNIVQAFTDRYKQLGGKIVDTESFTSGDKTIQNVVSRVNGKKADVLVTSTGFGDWPTFVAGLRSLGNKTPIMNSWAGDGTFWYPKNPKVTNYWYVTYASVFGDDPSAQVKALIAQMKKVGRPPATGGFITGASVVDGIAAAIKRAHGSTNGATLARIIQGFRNLPTISGRISFSAKLHSVFGRTYRVIEVQNNKPKVVGQIKASSPANIG
jgi:branched-chain amino acid transport system substrate-binding protein